MARYSSAMSWLFVAGLALSNAAVRAVETIEAQDVSSVSIEPNAVKPNDAANVWSWPDAITKTIGREPVTEWKEYLLKDPFGEGKDAIEASNLPPGLRQPKNNKGDQINWKSNGVRGSMPSITCPFGGSMDIDYYGKEKCIGVGQGICKDGWQFGIRQHVDNTYLMLWREDDPMNPVYKWFPGATQLCIGELYPNIAYLRITYEDNLYILIGRGAGDPNHLARLKIVPDSQHYKDDDVIVKFRDGPGDDNTLWQIFANGMSKTSPDALWYPIPLGSESPSSSPSASPTGMPSASPSASPTGMPSASPSTSPSSAPSPTPSISSSPSISSAPSSEPTAASCLPSPIMNIGQMAGGNLTFTFTSMPMAVFYVGLRTFIRGDFNADSEFANFFWVNSTSGQNSFIGQNDGGEQCGSDFLPATFDIPVEVYNSWVTEGSGTIPIFFKASDSVDFCDVYAEAYVQFQVDEECGTFSVPPSSQPSPTPSAMPSISAAPTTACDKGANVGTFRELKERIAGATDSSNQELIQICPDEPIVFESIVDFSEKHFKAECLGFGCVFDLDGFSFVTATSDANFTAEFQGISIENGSSNQGREGPDQNDLWGGAFFLRGVSPDASTLTLTNCTIRNNTAISDSGAIENGGASVVATDTVFVDNTCDGDGGVIYSFAGASSSFTNCRFEGNKATNDGGVFANFDDLSIDACYFSENVSDDDGGVLYSNFAVVRITNSLFSMNSAGRSGDASAASGGAIYSASDDNITVVDSLFALNTARDLAGAMYTSGIGELENCRFDGNSAEFGGAIYSRRETMISGPSTHFQCNAASFLGGAVNHFGGKLSVTDADIIANSASGLGGGIYLGEDANSDMIRCRFEQNTVLGGITTPIPYQEFGGGAIAFAQLSAPGAISTHTIDNTVFQNNTSVTSPSDDIFDYDSVYNTTATNIGQCGAGYGNCFCDADPLLVPSISTNVLPTTCSGAGVGPACPKCNAPTAPVICPITTRAVVPTSSGSNRANAMGMMEMMDKMEKEEKQGRRKDGDVEGGDED